MGADFLGRRQTGTPLGRQKTRTGAAGRRPPAAGRRPWTRQGPPPPPRPITGPGPADVMGRAAPACGPSPLRFVGFSAAAAP